MYLENPIPIPYARYARDQVVAMALQFTLAGETWIAQWIERQLADWPNAREFDVEIPVNFSFRCMLPPVGEQS